MMKRKNLWFVLILVFSLLTSGFQAPVFAADEGKQGTISVIGSDEANPLLAETAVQFSDNETAFDVLLKAVGESNVEFTDTAYGKMITGIQNVKAEGNYFWAFSINGIAAQMGADSYVVQNGDQISFRYTDWTKPAQNTVSIKVVDQENNPLRDVSGIEIKGSPTAFQLLQVALGPDQVGSKDTQYGKMIDSLIGLKAEGTYYWAFYVNGEMAQVGADSYVLQQGDKISFQYESWQDSNSDPEKDNGTPNPSSGTFSEAELNKAIESVNQYVLNQNITEWEAIALRQLGKSIPASYLENVKKTVQENEGKFSRITDTERYVLGILAAGGDPTNIAGYNLVEAVYNGNVTKQGLIGVAYALIALDSANFAVPDTAQWTRDKLVAYLLTRQNQDGGWAWNESTTSDSDTTAMILAALAPYKNQSGIKEKVDAAVQYLSTEFSNAKIDNSSTAAQVVIALSALGIDGHGPLFTKDGTSLMQFLLTFQNADGGFDWQGGDESDVFSTAQGIQAIVAYHLYAQGKGSLYNLTRVAQNPVTGEPEVKTPAQGNQSGHPLPNTATSTFNLLLAGFLLLMIGGFAYLKRPRQKA